MNKCAFVRDLYPIFIYQVSKTWWSPRPKIVALRKQVHALVADSLAIFLDIDWKHSFSLANLAPALLCHGPATQSIFQETLEELCSCMLSVTGWVNLD